MTESSRAFSATTSPVGRTTLGRRLYVGLLSLFALSAVATTLALSATRAVDAELARVERLAEVSRRLERVGALFREFYMHQAHLALGMGEAEHLALTREARQALGEALAALDHSPTDTPDTEDSVARLAATTLPALRVNLAALDQLLEADFLPALRAGETARAAHVHHHAAGTVQEATVRIEADQTAFGQSIAEARARAAAATQASTSRAGLVLGGGLLLSLLVAAWMVRTIKGPVERLRVAAQALPDRPPGARVPEDGPAEVAALGRALNAALGELDRQRHARAEAETMATLGRVASGVAHEINNPLAVILGHARLLERAVTADDSGSARAIADEARHCQHIVQDLLDYARPGLATRLAVDLTELVHAAADRLVRTTVAVRAPKEPVLVSVDPRRFESVLRNLLANAEAFAPSLQVDLLREADWACLRLTDDGPGVPADALERIFEPFYTTRPDGTGLGLAIARAVVHAHGGTLFASPGPGGRFELRLPIAVPAIAAVTPVTAVTAVTPVTAEREPACPTS